jgi:hypothetical protein
VIASQALETQYASNMHMTLICDNERHVLIYHMDAGSIALGESRDGSC